MVISMDQWKGKVAVVTGANAGIGVAIVEQLVDAGLLVVGLARRNDKVKEQAKQLQNRSGKLYALKADVSKEEEIIHAFKWIKNNLGPVNILINNAGFARDTALIDGETQKWKEIIETNVLGLCIATREAVKDMRANNIAGHIVHINSLAGHLVPNYPGMSVYPASKYAVTALAETLRQELISINSKIKISSISPWSVRSEFVQAGGYDASPQAKKYLQNAHMLGASDIADAIIYILSTPPHVQIHDLIIRPVGQTM